MNGIVLLLISTACFAVAYFVYSKFLGRAIGIKPNRPTPAVTMNDGVDYVPAHPAVLFGHHFASIAGAGPIVGPILAAEFGWKAVVLWVIFGCIFIGAMHDMISLYLSIRHNGRSIATVTANVLGSPGRIIFLLFCWSALILVCAEFTRLVAATFTTDPAVATASLMFIAEAIIFGLCVYRLKMRISVASLIFVPIMFACVIIGMRFPLDLETILGVSSATEQTIWTYVLLAYCFAASTLPVWVLLQPRDYLNSYLLYAMMAAGFLGVFLADPTLKLDAFTGLSVMNHSGRTDLLFPFLFVTIACGACSGFHALVASGTTAKQISKESHIRPVAYGGMLLEGVLAILALIAIGTMTQSELNSALSTQTPTQLFSAGIAGFCTKLGMPFAFANTFITLSIAAFLMTSVDTATRLARFTWQELCIAIAPRHISGSAPGSKPTTCFNFVHNMYTSTGVVIALVAAFLLGSPITAKNIWPIFASANQLLAALTLLTAALWLFQHRRPWWMVAIPMLFMFAVCCTALVMMLFNSTGLLRCACAFLLFLASILVALVVRGKWWIRR